MAAAAARAVVPFDYAASFRLTGNPGNLIQDVINIGAEGKFVAMAIGYGFEEDRGLPLLVSGLPAVPDQITLGQIPVEALLTGFRVNSRFEALVFKSDDPFGPGTGRRQRLSNQPVAGSLQANLFQRIKPPQEISFLLSMVDTSTGRELQDEPTHNLASLGKSNGERPFRMLAHPLTFMPRSTLRLQISEGSEGAQGTLFIVLYGYKMLAPSICPEPVMRALRGSPDCPMESVGRPSERVIPFDYVTSFDLTGRPGNVVDDEITINAEGGFVATSLGYGLAPGEQDVEIQYPPPADLPEGPLKVAVEWLKRREKDPQTAEPAPPIDLGALPLRFLPASALSDGFRVRANLTRLAFQNDGALNRALPVDLADKVFERLNRPEDVSFRYTIHDGGRGMDLQNQPIHNIAGLGIANGDRPFKKFVRPLIFLPRSTIQVRVQEQFGRGRLYLVFQGYKLLGLPAPGGRP